MGVAVAGLYTTLQSPFSGSGTQNGGVYGTYFTDIGPMVISSNNDQAATFTVQAVPEPSSAILLTIGWIAAVAIHRRRSRSRGGREAIVEPVVA
jgi:PEP-CTERM motif